MKVVHEESKGKHKLSLKIGDEFTGKGMEEIKAYLDSHVSMVQSKEEAVIARSHILDICQELGISPMGTEELKEFVAKLEAK